MFIDKCKKNYKTEIDSDEIIIRNYCYQVQLIERKMEYYLFKGEGRKKFIIPKNMVIFIFLLFSQII